MKKLSDIAWMLVVAVSCLHAQTKFNDLPADYRKEGFPQLVEQCKGVFDGAYMAENKHSTHYDIPNWEGFPV